MTLCVLVLLVSAAASLAAPGPIPPVASEEFADWLYSTGRFAEASPEYRRLLLHGGPATPIDANRLRNKLALAHLHRRQYREAADTLSIDAPDFPGRYLRMYATLRMGLVHSAIFEQNRIRNDAGKQTHKIDEADLLAGTVLLESGSFGEAARHYRDLRRRTENQEIRQISTEMLNSIARFQEQEKKRAWLAGALSAVLPGAGQYYAGHEADAVTALFFNTMFLGSAVAIYDLESRAGAAHSASLVFGLIGLVFYASNIVGAVASAGRYNVHQERLFQERVRESFFNLERVERVADIRFHTKF